MFTVHHKRLTPIIIFFNIVEWYNEVLKKKFNNYLIYITLIFFLY